MTREQLYADIQAIWQKQRKTVVFVTHNVREAICLGDRILLMSASPGRIVEDFSIALERPRDINSIDVARHALEIRDALKQHQIHDPRESG
jgi:NitT/TauT family transport system ATP-binding protein